ncbi:MAG: hypothetical protein P9L94_20510 [Candidatus Hinthialibacter antarcticus]|nr:hypothetical protein [Candidatus Hinthialibacter antarcticus]
MASTKKVLLWGCLGCGGFLALLIVLALGGVGFFAYQAVQFGTEIAKEYTTLTQNYEQLDQEIAFTPPENQLFTDERLKEYFVVRSSAVKFAEQYGDTFGKMGDEIGQTFDKGGVSSKISGAGKIGEIIKQAAMMPATIGNEHLKLLREAQMSPDEYVWFTREVLGVLLKAKDNEFEAGQTMWDNYIPAFEKARDHIKGMNINTGQFQIDGNDIQLDSLLGKVNDVTFIQENAELIAQNTDQFVMEGNATILDYMALHLKEILADFSQKHDGPQAPQEVAPQAQ